MKQTQFVSEFPAFYRIWTSTAVFTRAWQWSLSCARKNHLHNLVTYVFKMPLNIILLPTHFLSDTCYIHRPSHCYWFDLPNFLWTEKLLVLLVMHFLPASCYCHLYPYILLCFIFQAASFYILPSVWETKFRTLIKQTGKITGKS